MRKSRLSGAVRRFLTYSSGERNGTIVLAALLLLSVAGSVFYRPVASLGIVDRATYEKVDSIFTALHYAEPEANAGEERSVLYEELPAPRRAKEFRFNPNTVSTDSLIDLGLSPRQAQVVANYRSKGGCFRTPDDFSKIHVIDSSTFQRLRPWIDIPPEAIASADTLREFPAIPPLELNSADTVSLTRLKGIGRSFARRIVAYRELLGGFYSVNQLGEVYGLSPEMVSTLRPHIRVDSAAIRRININLIGYDELKEHPYLTDYQAKSIIYYRGTQGSIARLNELVEHKLLPPERYQKIAPYLTVK